MKAVFGVVGNGFRRLTRAPHGREFTIWITAFLAGLILPPFVDHAFRQVFVTQSILESVSILASVFVLIFVVLIAAYLSVIVRALDDAKDYRISFHRDHYDLSNGKKVQRLAFAECAFRAEHASTSIVVFGPHFDKRFEDQGASQGSLDTESHDRYLVDSMSQAVRRHLSSRDNFKYFRIVQVDKSDFKAGKEGDGRLAAAVLNNRGLVDHLSDVLGLRRARVGLSVEIVVRPYLPSFPSVLIIDDRYVFFSLPTDPEEVSGNSVAYDTVLGFEDRSGEIPRHLSSIIMQFRSGGFELAKIS